MVLEEFQCGARIIAQETTLSTWIGSPASQLLELGCDPTGVELPLRDDSSTLAMSHAESNTTASISVPVHGPVVVGSDTGGTSSYSSAHLSDDRFERISNLDTRSFRDAGDMRSEAEGNGL